MCGAVRGLALSQCGKATVRLFHPKVARAFATSFKTSVVLLSVGCVVGVSQQGALHAPFFISKMRRCQWLVLETEVHQGEVVCKNCFNY